MILSSRAIAGRQNSAYSPTEARLGAVSLERDGLECIQAAAAITFQVERRVRVASGFACRNDLGGGAVLENARKFVGTKFDAGELACFQFMMAHADIVKA